MGVAAELLVLQPDLIARLVFQACFETVEWPRRDFIRLGTVQVKRTRVTWAEEILRTFSVVDRAPKVRTDRTEGDHQNDAGGDFPAPEQASGRGTARTGGLH